MSACTKTLNTLKNSYQLSYQYFNFVVALYLLKADGDNKQISGDRIEHTSGLNFVYIINDISDVVFVVHVNLF